MILVGELSLWVALLMAAWAATVSFAGGQLRRDDLIESGERAMYATLAMVVLASLGLWTALLTHDFSIKYVASFTSANLPKVYTITAFWGGQSGSLCVKASVLAWSEAANPSSTRSLAPPAVDVTWVLGGGTGGRAPWFDEQAAQAVAVRAAMRTTSEGTRALVAGVDSCAGFGWFGV